jgi:biotin transport system substrate-specific component
MKTATRSYLSATPAPTILRHVGLISAFVLALGLSSQWKFTLPYSPVPMTLQTFVVALAGLTLGWKRGLAVVAATLALGTLGAPFFAIPTLMGATTGYLVGFIPMVLFAGWTAEKLAPHLQAWSRPKAFVALWTAAFLASVPCLGLGALWLKIYLGMDWTQAITVGVIPFMAGDLYKTTAAATVALSVALAARGRSA